MFVLTLVFNIYDVTIAHIYNILKYLFIYYKLGELL